MKGETDTPQADRTSMASTKADLRELRSNSSATVRELQEFLRELRGKSPQEMLGVVASSQLFRATILSVVLVTGAILLFTALPFFFGDEPTPAADTKPIAAAPASPAPPAAEPKAADGPKKPVDLAPLGVNDKLPAPTNTNPLEDKKTDFLKDLE
ncbi:MAG: hypothetical protein AB8F34_09460 [Akkermansiaceae bacterium]